MTDNSALGNFSSSVNFKKNNMNAYKAKELKSRSRGNCNNLRVLPPRKSGGTPLTLTRY